MPDRTDSYSTLFGSILSGFTVLLVLSYTVFKLQSLLAASDHSVTKNVQFEYYKPEDVFGFEDNF